MKNPGFHKVRHSIALSQLLYYLLLLPVSTAFALEDPGKKTNTKPTNPYLAYQQKRRIEIRELETCSWLVTYRKRIYDLSPLTRRSLERPLEGDMHTILRRVPEAEAHLAKISQNNRDAKVHTTIATLALASLLVTRIVQGSSTSKGTSQKYMALNIGSALLFLRATYAGWQLKRETKDELVSAIQEFNNVSEDPILPYEGGM